LPRQILRCPKLSRPMAETVESPLLTVIFLYARNAEC